MSLHHPDERTMQAFADGELLPADAERVRAHCERCDACAAKRDGLRELAALLRADATERPLRPVWPHVQARLPRRVRFDRSFVFGTGLAVTAGLLLGIALGATSSGSGASSSAAAGSSSSGNELMSWASWGSTLPDVYGLESEEPGS